MGSFVSCMSKCLSPERAIKIHRSVRGVGAGEFIECVAQTRLQYTDADTHSPRTCLEAAPALRWWVRCMFYSLLPVLKLALGDLLCDLNKTAGGLDLGVYRLKAVPKSKGGDLQYDEFIKSFTFTRLEITSMHHRQELKVLTQGALDNSDHTQACTRHTPTLGAG